MIPSATALPASFKTAPVLTPHLVSLAREILQQPREAHAAATRSVVRGHPITVTSAAHAELQQIINDVDQGRETDPALRLANALGQLVMHKASTVFDLLPSGAHISAAAIAVALGSGNDASETGTGARQTWANQLANQVVQPLQIYRPVSLCSSTDPQSIATILGNALESGCAVKAAGSGHSYSDVATTPDFFIDTHGLATVASAGTPITGGLTQAMLKPGSLPLADGPVTFPSYSPATNFALVEMEAGITIRTLNQLLESWDLGLMNMGGYDGQTIVGAISTSTHGSGITLGPFPDMVRSLVLATTGKWNGTVVSGPQSPGPIYYYRIEPSAGITDPTKYQDPQIGLIQDDTCFQATICSMGCFGVIYSVVLEVMQMYYLSETRTLSNLQDVLDSLAAPAGGGLPPVLASTRNYEVLIHPYPMFLDFFIMDMDLSKPPSHYYKHFPCLVTERNIAPKPDNPKKRINMPSFLAIILNLILDRFPEAIPDAVTIAMLTQKDSNWVGAYYEVYNEGLAGDFGIAAEIGFSLDAPGGAYTSANFQSAIDWIHRTAQISRLQGKQYQTSPFSLRFVKASDASLSMMSGRNTAMIEMDMLTGTYGGKSVLYRYETGMYALGGRPHWGLEFDFMTGSNDLVAALYPTLPAWLSVYRQFNRLGTFNNSFTQRMGFTAGG